MNVYCTLFDRNYLERGLALYRSLNNTTKDFTLYILAMDEEVKVFFKKNTFINIQIITLENIMIAFPELVTLQTERTKAEFCWTMTSYVLSYCIQKYKLESCVYLDSDIYFFSDPKNILDQIGDKSVLITEHRYTPEYDQSKTSGKYCVQFMYFKNNSQGIAVLDWWRQRCNEWCYNRMEDGKFGDQKYLDDWTTRFEGVVVSDHIGFGLAPWNIQQFTVIETAECIKVKENITKLEKPVVFYHFHSLKQYSDNNWYLSGYETPLNAVNLIYKPYINELMEIQKSYLLRSELPFYTLNENISSVTILKKIKRNIHNSLVNFFKGINYNIVKKKLVMEKQEKLLHFVSIKEQ